MARLADALGAEYLELANSQYYSWAHLNRDHLLPTSEQIRRAEAVTDAALTMLPLAPVAFKATLFKLIEPPLPSTVKTPELTWSAVAGEEGIGGARTAGERAR